MSWRYKTIKQGKWTPKFDQPSDFEKELMKMESEGWEYVGSFPITTFGNTTSVISTFRQSIK